MPITILNPDQYPISFGKPFFLGEMNKTHPDSKAIISRKMSSQPCGFVQTLCCYTFVVAVFRFGKGFDKAWNMETFTNVVKQGTQLLTFLVTVNNASMVANPFTNKYVIKAKTKSSKDKLYCYVTDFLCRIQTHILSFTH